MKGARIFHIDVDPLKEQMPLFYIAAQKRYKADAETALTQILDALEGKKIDTAGVKSRLQYLSERHNKRIQKLDELEGLVSKSSLTTPVLMGYFRKIIPKQSTIMIEVSRLGEDLITRVSHNTGHVLITSVQIFQDKFSRLVQEVWDGD